MVYKFKEQYMNRLTFCEIKYMNWLFFSKAGNMIWVSFKILTRTPVPKLPRVGAEKWAIRHTHLYYVIYRVPPRMVQDLLKRRRLLLYGIRRPSKICVMHIPLHRCLVTFGVSWLFLTVLWVGLQSVIVVFPDHTHSFSTYFLHTHPYFK